LTSEQELCFYGFTRSGARELLDREGVVFDPEEDEVYTLLEVWLESQQSENDGFFATAEGYKLAAERIGMNATFCDAIGDPCHFEMISKDSLGTWVRRHVHDGHLLYLEYVIQHYNGSQLTLCRKISLRVQSRSENAAGSNSSTVEMVGTVDQGDGDMHQGKISRD